MGPRRLCYKPLALTYSVSFAHSRYQMQIPDAEAVYGGYEEDHGARRPCFAWADGCRYAHSSNNAVLSAGQGRSDLHEQKENQDHSP